MKPLVVFLPAVMTLMLFLSACKKNKTLAPELRSDRQVSVSADKLRPTMGANITFTLIAKNYGPTATTGISVNDMLPTGCALVSANTTAGSYTSGIWSGFGLANGATATLIIVAKVNTSDNFTNLATITGIEKDPAIGNNTSTIHIIPETDPNNVNHFDIDKY